MIWKCLSKKTYDNQWRKFYGLIGQGRIEEQEKKGYCLKNLVKNPFFMIENGENAYAIKGAREQTTLDFLPSMKKES